MAKTCSVSGCGNPARSRDLCNKHYIKWRRDGDPKAGRENRTFGDGFFLAGYLAHQIDGVKKFDHVRIAERALGGPLPPGVVVHHADEDRLNNANSNLVICPDRAYHNLLHARMEAMKVCGNPNWRKCIHCKEYDSPASLRIYQVGKTSRASHPACQRAHGRRQYAETKLRAA